MGFSDRRWDKDPEEDKGWNRTSYWADDERDKLTPLKKNLQNRRFSLDFLSKIQKQTIAAVMLFFVVLASKYSGDPASGTIYAIFGAALSPQNDYSVALNDAAKNLLGSGGNTLAAAAKNGPMQMPVNGSVVSGFGWQVSPLDQKNRYNTGIDVAAPLGSSVQAPMAGTVVKVGSEATLGRYVKIDHGGGLISVLSNLGEVKVKDQQKVNKGDVLGTLGFTAAVQRPWLHWEVRRSNQPLNPQSLVGKPAKI